MLLYVSKVSRSKIIGAVIIGILIVLLFKILLIIVSFLYTSFLFTNFNAEELIKITKQPSFAMQIITRLLQILSLLSYVIGGYFVGKRLKEKGWLYGGIVGLILAILGIIISLLPLIIPTNIIYGTKVSEELIGMVRAKVLSQLIKGIPASFLELTILTGFGGTIGEYFSKRKR